MATSVQIRNIPDRIRAHYDAQHIEQVQMAKEVPRKHQRNPEDIQLLKFPSTKNILWDHTVVGEPHTLHIACYRKPRLCVSEKVLRFAQRHAESTNQTACVSVLVGTLDIDADGEGVVLRVERLDPLGDTNTSSSQAAGDMLIPFTLLNGSKQRGSSLEDYSSALQLLKQRCCSKDPVELGNFLLTKGWSSYYTGGGDASLHHLEFDLVTPGLEIQATPIEAVPIVPTALSKNLAGPMSISHMQGIPKTGYLTMDHTRKLLLVLESDPKVTSLPLVGIWVSGVAHAHSAYVWACCLRYLHNTHIQDRVCSPPEPFLLVLYNPTHSKPEFYECVPASGTSRLTFDHYTGYEAISLAKLGSSSPEALIVVDMEAVQSGQKQDLFDAALSEFSSKQPLDESGSSSPEPVASQDDITPRSQPAPHKSRMPMLQSMVPEVSLFFGNGANETCVPNIQNPKPAPAGNKPSMSTSNRPPDARPPPHTSTQPYSHGYNGTVSSATSSSRGYTNSNPTTGPHANSANGHVNASMPNNTYPNPPRPVHPSMPVSSTRNNNVYTGQGTGMSSQYQPRPNPAGPPQPTSVPHQAYMTAPHPANTQQPRLGFCDCPSCPRPQTGQYSVPHPYGVPPPCSAYRPPARLSHPGYAPAGQPAGYAHQPYPMPVGDYPRMYPPPPTSAPYPGNSPYNLPPSQSVGQLPGNRTSTGMPANPPMSQSERYNTGQPTQVPSVSSVTSPQTTTGLPMQSSGKDAAITGTADIMPNQNRASGVPMAADGQRSNPHSDNSGRSSDDSGLSFTPEKQGSPSNTSPQPAGGATELPALVGLAGSGVQWDSVPPEIYRLLLQQDQQLKQLQAQISVLTAQQARDPPTARDPAPRTTPQVASIATNTSLAFPQHKEQVSACMQTSPQESHIRQNFHHPRQSRNTNQDVSQSGSSGCETRTPLEIRHRGHRPINSTQRDDVDLDMSQGELVAIVNNLHDTTIDSVQSEMIVDLPSFQSSPTRSPRSQESCADSMFNLSPRSPISASMCQPSTSEYSDDEDPGDDTGADNPEYYAKLMDNIKKLLSQNTSEETNLDGYQGDVSSDPSTPIKMAHQNFNIGEAMQSFLKFDPNQRQTDTTFIPRINYVSMFLDSDTDTSMEINAMAMKYLKDEQLTQLTKLQARNRLLKAPKYAAQKTAVLQKILKAEDVDTTQNVSSFGISPNDLTFATKKYMEKHGLLDGGSSGRSMTTSDTTCGDSFRLKTNYSTVSAGSDGPAQVTQEVISTPTGHQRAGLDSTTPSSGRIQYHDDGPLVQTPFDDSGVSAGFTGTPKPQHTSRRTGEHRRFTPNHNDSHNNSVPKPYSHNASPFTHNTSAPRQENGNKFGAIGRFASPQITPAVPRRSYSPPEKDEVDIPRNYHKNNNPVVANGDHGDIRANFNYDSNDRRLPNVVNHVNNNDRGFPNVNRANNERDVPNAYNVRQQFGGREETIDDDRILDITRLKHLPKLL